MSSLIPHNISLKYTREHIAARVAEIGLEVDAWAREVYSKLGSQLLVVPVLRGGMFFFADLVRQIQISVEVAPSQVWAYETDTHASPKNSLELRLSESVTKDRSILIVDDICDSGRTLSALIEAFEHKGAADVRTAVLIKRGTAKPVREPTWTAFHFSGPDWFVGYGMDDREHWRNLPDIYIINPS